MVYNNNLALLLLLFVILLCGECKNIIDLNTATLDELDTKLPYITRRTAEMIIKYRPICSPFDLTKKPKKIPQITRNRVLNNWGSRVVASCDDNGAPSCSDGKLNGIETDVDCGGNCDPCAIDKKCKVKKDCAGSMICHNNKCAKKPPVVNPTTSSVANGNVKFNENDKVTHHTEKYMNVPSNVIIRRRDAQFSFAVGGQLGNVGIRITWAEDIEKNSQISFESATALFPQWKYEIKHGSAQHVVVNVHIPIDTPIGQYKLEIMIKGRQDTMVYDLIVLYNPWSSNDVVGAGRDKAPQNFLDEYILNHEGLIWQGVSDDNTAHVWNFDQWNYKNLDTALDLLHRLGPKQRTDVAIIVRHLSFAIQDVCYGKWGDGSYTTGRPPGGYKCSKKNPCVDPGKWTGSTGVLDLHRHTGKPSQYCQCFVFAGVFTTIGRTLGIPSRVVTNFQSAHDTNRNRAIEKFYHITNTGSFDVDDDATEEKTSDSIWSFHVWNEFYIQHHKDGVGSLVREWLMSDATPQEESDGPSAFIHSDEVMLMGPVAISTIKKNMDKECKVNGKKSVGCFDNEFAISEVNSNVNIWVREGNDQTFRFYGSFEEDPWDDYNTIGLQISTKKIGPISANCRDEGVQECEVDLDDLTLSYKKAEPSGPGNPTFVPVPNPNEKYEDYIKRVSNVQFNFIQMESNNKLHTCHSINTVDTIQSDVVASVSSDSGMFLFREDQILKVYLNLKNSGERVLEAHTMFKITGMNYANFKISNIHSESKNIKIPRRGKHRSHTFSIPARDFVDKMNAKTSLSARVTYLRVFVSVRVTDLNNNPNGQILVHERKIRVCYPVRQLRNGMVCDGGGRYKANPKHDIIQMKSLKMPLSNHNKNKVDHMIIDSSIGSTKRSSTSADNHSAKRMHKSNHNDKVDHMIVDSPDESKKRSSTSSNNHSAKRMRTDSNSGNNNMNPCKPNPCKADEICHPDPKMCITTPCHQYKCVKRQSIKRFHSSSVNTDKKPDSMDVDTPSTSKKRLFSDDRHSTKRRKPSGYDSNPFNRNTRHSDNDNSPKSKRRKHWF